MLAEMLLFLWSPVSLQTAEMPRLSSCYINLMPFKQQLLSMVWMKFLRAEPSRDEMRWFCNYRRKVGAGSALIPGDQVAGSRPIMTSFEPLNPSVLTLNSHKDHLLTPKAIINELLTEIISATTFHHTSAK